MYVSKKLIKETGYVMRNYMFIDDNEMENDTAAFVRAIGDYMRNWSVMDYATKRHFIEVLKEFIQNNEIVLEDENMFIGEVVKNLPFKVWETE